MIKLEKTTTYGWDEAIRGMRNPMNSWDKSDSGIFDFQEPETWEGKEWIKTICLDFDYLVGPNDLKLMKNLAKAGTSHSKFRRMITVYVDITAPLYWWKEFDTYKVGTVANSCSTMHKIAEKEFTLDDFSHEHVIGWGGLPIDEYINTTPHTILGDVYVSPHGALDTTVKILNACRESYLETKDKKYWWQMIQLLPSSYNQKRTVMMNYEVVAAICKQRYGHKLDEWHDFIEWAHKLPLAKEIIFCEEGDHEAD